MKEILKDLLKSDFARNAETWVEASSGSEDLRLFKSSKPHDGVEVSHRRNGNKSLKIISKTIWPDNL